MFLCFFSLATILLRLKKIKDSGEFFFKTHVVTWTDLLGLGGCKMLAKLFCLHFFLFLFKIIIFFMQQSVKGSGLLQVSSRNSSYPTPTCEGMKSSIRLNCDSPEVVSKQTTSKNLNCVFWGGSVKFSNLRFLRNLMCWWCR